MIGVEGLCVRAGDFVLSELSFVVPEGRYAALMGRTGSGKTTVLEVLCGLRQPEAGKVWIGGREVQHEPPASRGLAYVPQDGALFPTLSVREHLAFAPEVCGEPASVVRQRVGEWAERLALGPLLDRGVRGLSGGERQKVALGRALASNPAALLLDEPLAALDEASWVEALALLQELHSTTELTVLHVTHRSAEASAIADLHFHLVDGVVHEHKIKPRPRGEE